MSILGTEPGRPRRERKKTGPDNPPLGLTATALFGMGALLMGLGLWGTIARPEDELSFLFGLGFVFLAGSVPFLGAFLFEDWFLAGEDDLLDAFASRDRRGRAFPGLRLVSILRERNGKLLADQPAASLLALAAAKERHGQVVATALGLKGSLWGEDLLTSLARHPDATVLTKIAFATRPGGPAPAVAAGALPARLWPRALQALLASQQSQARLAALRCEGIPRRRLLGLVARDPDHQVRRTAAERVSGDLSPKEALALLRSPHDDARLLAVFSRLLPRSILVNQCLVDSSAAVRARIREGLAGKLHRWEANRLAVGGRSPDERLYAVRADLPGTSSPALSRRRLVKLCARDPDSGVRAAAWERLRQDLDASEALRLSRSEVPEVVRQAIGSGALAHRRLLRLAATEELPEELRRLAYAEIRKLRGPKEWS